MAGNMRAQLILLSLLRRSPLYTRPPFQSRGTLLLPLPAGPTRQVRIRPEACQTMLLLLVIP